MGKLDALSTLQANGAEFLERMKLYVYPYIGGKDHVMLLLLFTYVQQCCGDEAKMEVSDASSISRHRNVVRDEILEYFIQSK